MIRMEYKYSYILIYFLKKIYYSGYHPVHPFLVYEFLLRPLKRFFTTVATVYSYASTLGRGAVRYVEEGCFCSLLHQRRTLLQAASFPLRAAFS